MGNIHIIIHWLIALFRWLMMMLIIPIIIIVLLCTPAGLKVSVAIMSKIIPGQLHYRQITGSLIGGPLAIEQLDYRYQNQRFTAKKIWLKWRPGALIQGKLYIDQIKVTDLSTTITEDISHPPEKITVASVRKQLEEFRLLLSNLHLPFNLQIVQGSVNHLSFGQRIGEFPIQISAINLSTILQADKVKLDLKGQLVQPYPMQMQLSVNGSPRRYQLQITAFNPQTHWQVTGEITPQQIQLDTPNALIFGGRLAIHLVWQLNNPTWELKLEGQHLDLSQLQTDWPHPLDIKLSSNGYLVDNSANFSWNAMIKTANTQVETQGRYGKQWDIAWNIVAQQIAELLPFASGSIHSTGELHGTLDHPQTKGFLQANLLRWQQYRIDKLSTHWNIDIADINASEFQLNASQLFSNTFHIQQLALSGLGKWDKHQLNAAIHGYDTDMTFVLNGGFGVRDWRGSLNKLMIFAPHAGKWELSKPTALLLTPERVDITAMCLQSGLKSQLCVKGQWQGTDNSWQAALTGRLNFQQLGTLLPEELTINVPLDLHASLQGIGKLVQQAQLTGNMGAGHIRYSDEETTLETGVKDSLLIAKIDKAGGSANLQINLNNNNSISANLNLPRVNTQKLLDPKQVLQGKILIQLNSLAMLQTLIPTIVAPSGKFRADFAVGGTVGQPLINGNAHLDQGNIKIPSLNIQLNNINLALGAKDKALFYTLSATSANQPLILVGKTDLRQPGLPTQINLTGEHVLLFNTPIYVIYVSPNVQLNMKGKDISIGGSVKIPRAIIRQLDFQSGTSLPLDEVVFVGEHPIVKKSPWNITTELTIDIGDDVRVDSPTLKGKLSGSLTLLSQPGQVMLGSGRININEGVYEVYGRKLTIAPNSGVVYRRNPLTNPSLNIQATTQVIVPDALSQQQLGTNEITVGMNIGGSSTSPQVTLFSSAGNLSQADMLSYLLLGTSSAGISPTNMNLLLQALNSLPLTKKGASGVEGITNQIKQGLGFSEFGVESENTYGPGGEKLPTSTPTSYFVVGKRLTSRIYLRYKYDPFNSVNLFQLNYFFSKNWSLQLETDGNTQSGADILYTIETGTAKSADKTPENKK